MIDNSGTALDGYKSQITELENSVKQWEERYQHLEA
jgi:hypothetical protein